MFTATPQQLETTILQIAEAITRHDDAVTVSLLGGKAGHALFYGHLYQYFGKEEHFEQFSIYLDDCIAWVAEEPTNATLSRGFGGLMWVVQHFIRVGLLDESASAILPELDSHLEASLEVDVIEHSYDLLHGLVGKGLYFLERLPDPASLQVVNRIVDQLASFSVADADTVSWPDPDAYAPTIYNLGMAHGVPSIISFLAKAHASGVHPAQTRQLVEKSVNWLLRQEKPSGYSRYTSSTAHDTQSRLSWCYGDLGPALALFHAAQALGRDDWRSQAIELARHAGRRTSENAGLNYHTSYGWHDTSFCHGTAGIAHIFHRFYQATHLKEFQRIAHYWLALSGPPASPDQGTAGYVHLQFDAARNSLPFRDNSTLLNGATGVGLVLLSFLQPQHPAWDGFFMTDI